MAEIKSPYTARQRALYRFLFKKELGLAPTTEERLRLGQASRADSIAAKLTPGAAAPSEYEKLLGRLPAEARPKADSIKAGLLSRATKATLSDYEKLRLRLPPEVRAKMDSIKAGLLPRAGKPEEPERESLLAAGSRYADIEAKTKKQLGEGPVSFNEAMAAAFGLDVGKTELFEKGSPTEKNLRKRLEAYGDSSAIVSRALQKFTPDTDINELLNVFPVAEQAWNEFVELSKKGGGNRQAAQEAAEAIKNKYGYDIETIRNALYVKVAK